MQRDQMRRELSWPQPLCSAAAGTWPTTVGQGRQGGQEERKGKGAGGGRGQGKAEKEERREEGGGWKKEIWGVRVQQSVEGFCPFY